MSRLRLNLATNWKYLPWQRIYIRSCKIRNKIYQASRECNIIELHKFRKNIMYSSDAKIIAIQKLSNYIDNYYFSSNRKKYSLNDKDKFFIYKILSGNYVLDKYVDHIIRKVKQYIISMYIKPEREAKLELIYKLDKHDRMKLYSWQKLNKKITKNLQNQDCDFMKLILQITFSRLYWSNFVL